MALLGGSPFGSAAFGSIPSSGVTRRRLRVYRHTGFGPPPVTSAFGELAISTAEPALWLGLDDGSWAQVPDLAHLDAAVGACQPLDADLTALAGLATTGVVQRTGSGAFSAAALSSGDIPDLSSLYALAGLASIFTGSGNTSTYQQTTSTSWVRLNSQISGVDGITWTNSSGRTQQVLVLITCSVSSDGLHASYFRVGCSGSGVTATLQGSFRTPVSNYVPATLAAVVSVTSGSTATLYVQASVSGGGTAYLHEGGDSTWTLIGIPIG